MTTDLAELSGRFAMLQNSGLWLEVPDARKDEVTHAVLEVESFGQLPADVQDLIRRGELDVAAGNSPSLQDPADWGDYGAIDAALEAGPVGELDAAGLARLDAALLTLGGYGSRDDSVRAAPIQDESKAFSIDDDDGWVG